MSRNCTLLIVCLSFFLSPPLQAQQRSLKPDMRVRITAPTYFTGQLIGVVTAVTTDSLTITHGNSAGPRRLKNGTTSFPLQALTKIERGKGPGNSDASMAGGVIGFFTGLGITGLLGKTALSGEKSLALVIVAPITIVSTTVLGILINRRERWETIQLVPAKK